MKTKNVTTPVKFKLILYIIITLVANMFNTNVSGQVKKPNIVLFIADDLGVNDIGPYGNKKVRTPHLDKLAKESMTFTSAFAAAPTCAPSRMSIFTGLYPQRHGAVANQMGVNSNVLSIVQYFKPLGYKVAIAGKLHIGPQEIFDFELIIGTNGREPGTEGMKGMFGDLVLDPVGGWLARQKTDTPFVLVVADHSPHVTWPLQATYQSNEVDVPAQLIDTDLPRKLMARFYTDVTQMDANLVKLRGLLDKNGFGNAVFMFTADQGPQWPFGKWTLYDYGIQAPLIVKWPGQINANSTTKAIVSHVDIIPTLLELVNAGVPGNIDGKSFYKVLKNDKLSHHDMVYASHSGDKMNNRSVIRMVRSAGFKYIINLTSENETSLSNPNDVNVKQIPNDWYDAAYKDSKAAATMWRLIHKPYEELYDVKNDPNELVNLAYNKEYKKVLEQFRAQMEIYRKAQGDTTGRWKQEMDFIPKTVDSKSVAPYTF